MGEVRRRHIYGERSPLRELYRDPIAEQIDDKVRSAIRSVSREPVLPLVPYIPKCGLCTEVASCSGMVAQPEQASEVVFVPESYDDWDTLKQQISVLKDQNVPLRLVMERKVPKRILWMASYSDKNVFQVNVNLLQVSKDVEKSLAWAERVMILANRCGVYCVVMLHPVVPGVVSSYHAIAAIDRLKGHGLFQTVIRFCEIVGQCERKGEYLDYNGVGIKASYMVKTTTGWKCSNYFKSLFMNIVQQYAAPRKLNVSVCEGQSDYMIGD